MLNTTQTARPTEYLIEDAANGATLMRSGNLGAAVIAAHTLAQHVGTDMEIRAFADGSLVREVHADDDVEATLRELGVYFK